MTGVKILHKQESEHFKNNETDFEKIIFEMFYQRVYNIAYFLVQDQYLAQDIVQETFIKAFKHIDKVKDGKKLGAWIGKIATTTSIDFLRKRKKQNDIPIEDVYIEINSKKGNERISPVENLIERKLLKSLIKQNLNKLKPEHKEILILKYEYDLKDEEISEVLGLSVSAAKSRLHRAKGKFRTVLNNQGDIFRDGESHEN